MKKILCAILALALSATVLFCGCSLGGSSEVNVTVNNNFTTMTDEQWKEYIEKLDGNEPAKLQAVMNRSLLCGVSILTRFTYKEKAYFNDTGFGSSVTATYHLVYCGSGVIVKMTQEDKAKGDAYVITNCHVVYSDSSVNYISDDVRLYLYGQDTEDVNYTIDGEYLKSQGKQLYDEWGEELGDYDIKDDTDYRINATVVAASVTYDIALLKITGSSVLRNSGAVCAEFAESDDVYVGEQVYAVGNPDGDGMSATVGYINKESETIYVNLSDYDDVDSQAYRVIRTDAAINGGNSGGALYNSDGKIVAIVNAKDASAETDNMGYALSASYVKRLWLLMKDNEVTGGVGRTTMGVSRAVFPAEYKAYSSVHHDIENGLAVITDTITVTRAGGGLQIGDVIKNMKITTTGGDVVEDRPVTRTYHLDDTLLSARNGYSVTFTVTRMGTDVEVTYTASTSKTA